MSAGGEKVFDEVLVLFGRSFAGTMPMTPLHRGAERGTS